MCIIPCQAAPSGAGQLQHPSMNGQKTPGGRTAKLVELQWQDFHKTVFVQYGSVGSSLTGPDCAWDIAPFLGCSETTTGSVFSDDDICDMGVNTRAPRALQAA